MSWGERSCGTEKKLYVGCGHNPTMGDCNVDCPYYVWDGKTKPDSMGTLTNAQRRIIRNQLELNSEKD